MPNGEFAHRAGLPFPKPLLGDIAGRKFDKMATQRDQTYRFVFVHEDGTGLAKVSHILEERQVQASVDGVFSLADVNAAMAKVAAGGSRGKTVLRIA